MQQVLCGGQDNDLPLNDTECNQLVGGFTWTNIANETARQQLVGCDGKIKNLLVKLQNAPVNSYTFTIRKNGADSTVTVTISGADTTGSDTTHEVTVSKGDLISFKVTPSVADPTVGNAFWSCIFEGDIKGESALISGSTDVTAANAMEYNQPTIGGYHRTIYTDCFQRCPCSGKLKNLYVELQNAPGGADNYVYTLYKNANPTALTVTIAGAATTGNDVANEVTIASGDTIAIYYDSSATAVTGYAWCGMTFVADTDGESMLMGNTYDPTPTVDTTIEYNYFCPSNSRTWTDVEATRYNLIQECTLKNLYVELNFGPGAGDTLTFTVRQNGTTDTSLSCAIDGVAVKNDVTADVAFSDFDYIDIKVVVAGTASGRDSCWGACCFIPTGIDSTLHLALGLGGYGNQGGRIPHADLGVGLQRHPRSRLC